MRLGVMGGTFDPIHLGHVGIARAALAQARLDRVIFLPDGDPPHKTPRAAGVHRLSMARLAVAGEERFSVLDMELARPGRTYTVDSLTELARLHPGCTLYYVIGSDTLFQFPKWKTAREVARLCHMLVALRPGANAGAVREQQRFLHAEFALDTEVLDDAGPDVSSSQIRHLVRDGQDVSNLVPPAVAEYIKANGLYLDNANAVPTACCGESQAQCVSVGDMPKAL